MVQNLSSCALLHGVLMGSVLSISSIELCT